MLVTTEGHPGEMNHVKARGKTLLALSLVSMDNSVDTAVSD